MDATSNRPRGLWLSPSDFKEVEAVDRRALSDAFASRSTAWDYTGILGLLPDPDPVLAKLDDGGASVLEALLADGHLTSVIQTRKLGTLHRSYTFQAGQVGDAEPDGGAVRLAEDFNADMEHLPLYDIISQLLDAPLYGMVPVEVTWKNDGGRIRIAGLTPLPARWFGFDEENRLRYISQKNTIDGEDVPWGKVVLCRHGATYDNPHGMRLLSRCFWPLSFKRGGLRFWVQFVERFGSPHVVGKYANSGDKGDMLTALTRMVQSAVAVIPSSAEVDVIQGNASGSSDTHLALKTAMDSEVSKVIVGQTLTTEVGDKGTQALGKVHQGVLEGLQSADQVMVASFFNDLAWVYGQINSGGVAAPVMTWEKTEDLQQMRAERDKTIAEANGVRFTSSYLIRTYGLEEGDLEKSPAPLPPLPLHPAAGKAALGADGAERDAGDGEDADSDAPGDGKGKGDGEFAEPGTAATAFPDQEALDRFIDSIPAGRLQSIADDAVKPVLDMIAKGTSYQDILASLAATYPAMDSAAMEEVLARAIFVAEVWGRLHSASR